MRISYLRTLIASAACFVLLEAVQAASVTTYPYRGMTYLRRTETVPRILSMHIVIVDLSAPGISFKVTSQGGTRDTIRQTTLDFLNQERAQAAISGHFFLP